MPEMLLVTWRDCESLTEWIDAATLVEFASRKRIIKTIGFRVEETDDHIILSSSYEAVFGKLAGCWIIPRCQILDVQTISCFGEKE